MLDWVAQHAGKQIYSSPFFCNLQNTTLYFLFCPLYISTISVHYRNHDEPLDPRTRHNPSADGYRLSRNCEWRQICGGYGTFG